MATDLSEFKDLYNKTAMEYLQKLQGGMATLTADNNNASAINELHISAHSLKSQSLVMGYTSTGHLCALLEKIFASVKAHTLTVTPQLIIAITTALSQLDQSIKRIVSDGQEADLTTVYEGVSQATDIEIT